MNRLIKLTAINRNARSKWFEIFIRYDRLDIVSCKFQSNHFERFGPRLDIFLLWIILNIDSIQQEERTLFKYVQTNSESDARELKGVSFSLRTKNSIRVWYDGREKENRRWESSRLLREVFIIAKQISRIISFFRMRNTYAALRYIYESLEIELSFLYKNNRATRTLISLKYTWRIWSNHFRTT